MNILASCHQLGNHGGQVKRTGNQSPCLCLMGTLVHSWDWLALWR